ncbi:hypothetical protein niasHT_000240 [Heterodera trifolii]|uniref:Uncharacterized protein n=1 Tax=Heterodera trifolii TaxID=157864 RepID=A0ABD2LVP4_9BILA
MELGAACWRLWCLFPAKVPMGIARASRIFFLSFPSEFPLCANEMAAENWAMKKRKERKNGTKRDNRQKDKPSVKGRDGQSREMGGDGHGEMPWNWGGERDGPEQRNAMELGGGRDGQSREMPWNWGGRDGQSREMPWNWGGRDGQSREMPWTDRAEKCHGIGGGERRTEQRKAMELGGGETDRAEKCHGRTEQRNAMELGGETDRAEKCHGIGGGRDGQSREMPWTDRAEKCHGIGGRDGQSREMPWTDRAEKCHGIAGRDGQSREMPWNWGERRTEQRNAMELGGERRTEQRNATDGTEQRNAMELGGETDRAEKCHGRTEQRNAMELGGGERRTEQGNAMELGGETDRAEKCHGIGGGETGQSREMPWNWGGERRTEQRNAMELG